MPDSDLWMIPPARSLPARPGALEATRRRAAEIRRHRRRAVVVAVAGVASTVLTALAWSGGESWRSLEPARRPPLTNSHPPRRDVDPSYAPRPADASRPPSPLATSAAPAPSPSVLRTPMLTLHVDGAPDPVDALDAVVFDPGAPDGLVCASSLGWTFGPAGWCIKLIASPPSGDPDTWFFGAIICRLPGTQRGVITNDQLPRLRMYDMGDGALVFDSEVRPWDALGDAAPSRTWGVDQGTCVMFNSPWASIDNDGNPVEEGPYQYDWDPTDSQFDAWANEHSGTVVTVGPNGES